MLNDWSETIEDNIQIEETETPIDEICLFATNNNRQSNCQPVYNILCRKKLNLFER